MSYLQQRHLRQTAASRQWSSSASLQSQRLSEIRDSSASTSIVYCNSRPRRTFSASAGYGFVATYLQRAFEHNPHPHQDEPQSLGANVAQFGFGPEKACRAVHWQDIEADEATFDKTVEDSIAHWEQWAGLVARGRPETLVLTRLTPPPTTARAPGPGAIRKVDWKPLANKWLVGKKVILHTDSARSYKAKVPGVLHDSVVHQKKRTKVRGKWVWKNPTFVKLRTHKLPNGKTIRRKAGTQIIDRAWRFIKDCLRLNQFTKVGSLLLRAQIRSAQYEYWHKGQDLWACTGQLLSNYMAGILA
jgi:hypothetical protein